MGTYVDFNVGSSRRKTRGQARAGFERTVEALSEPTGVVVIIDGARDHDLADYNEAELELLAGFL